MAERKGKSGALLFLLAAGVAGAIVAFSRNASAQPEEPTPLTHRICSGGSCITMDGEGINECSSDGDCGGLPCDIPSCRETIMCPDGSSIITRDCVGGNCVDTGEVCSGPPPGCTEGSFQCVGNERQQCIGGTFSTVENCTTGCPTAICNAGECISNVNINSRVFSRVCNPDGTTTVTLQLDFYDVCGSMDYTIDWGDTLTTTATVGAGTTEGVTHTKIYEVGSGVDLDIITFGTDGYGTFADDETSFRTC